MAAKKTTKLRRGGKIKPPKNAEVKYRRELLAIINAINANFKQQISPIIAQNKKPIIDAAGSNAYIQDGFIKEISEKLSVFQLLLNLDDRSQRFAHEFVGMVNTVNAAKMDNAIKAAGFEVSQLKSIAESEGITNAIEAMTAENAGLITRMSDDYIHKIQSAVVDNYLENKFEGKGGLQRELQRISGISKNRAKLIARDQTAKITGVMNQIRQEASGAVGYQWHNMRDQRVRGNPAGKYPNSKYNHWNREGRYYLWRPMKNPPIAPDGKPFRQPPKDGSPGIPINCRCYSSPVWVD